MNLKISQIKKQAKGALNGKWGLAALLTFLLFIAVELPPIIVAFIFNGGMTQNDSVGASIFQFIYSLAAIPLSFAFYWFYLNLIRGKEPKIPEVFSIYKNSRTTFKLIGVSLLQGLYVFLWSLLFFIPGFIKSISYSQTYFLLKDHPEYTVNGAIKESKKRMKGYKWKYFLLGLSFLGWGLLSILTFGIGLLWLVPYFTTSLATFYNELIEPQDHNEINKIAI